MNTKHLSEVDFADRFRQARIAIDSDKNLAELANLARSIIATSPISVLVSVEAGVHLPAVSQFPKELNDVLEMMSRRRDEIFRAYGFEGMENGIAFHQQK